MFNKDSIFFTLSISLIVAIILLLLSFFTIIHIDKETQFKNSSKKYQTISKIFNQEYTRFGFTNDLRDMIHDMDLLLIDDETEIQDILLMQDLELIMKRRSENILLHIFHSHTDNFLHFQTPFEEFLIIDKEVKHSKYNTITSIVFCMLLLMISLIAYSVYKKLAPLNELKDTIDSIGNKNIHLKFLKDNSQDEVSLLAKALIEKSQQLNNLKTARDVFIRNIMHELKTPITKGRFLIEIENTPTTQSKLQKVFFQLESLINEFAIIEEVIAKRGNISKKEIFFDDIFENVLDILMIEDTQCIKINQNTLKINVNFKLFSIAVKNLLDNALKYSKNKKVSLNIQEGSLSFHNQGSPLKYGLEKYYEPFFSYHENKSHKKESFGLGLYIVKSILDAHHFTLVYKYNTLTQENIFSIKF